MKSEKAQLNSETSPATVERRHLRWGWISLLVFLVLGIVLEALHGFKASAYLSPANATRRLMWTLAHAHGTLLGLVHLALAFSVGRLPDWDSRRREWASLGLRMAGVLMPAGFFLGGIQFYKADPGLGIILVPPGAILLLISVFLTARATLKK
ncbi:MAG: hypothetical protein FJ404_17055 [Verrucomicrobia bacterium]|nr:hypothetical protein [Verrucomicrobiota bacterium]